MFGPASSPRLPWIASAVPASVRPTRRSTPRSPFGLTLVALLIFPLLGAHPLFAGNPPLAWRTDRLLIQPRKGSRTDPTSPTLQLQGPRSATCQVEVSADLEEWNPLTTIALSAEGTATVGTSVLGSTETRRFYRALLLP